MPDRLAVCREAAHRAAVDAAAGIRREEQEVVEQLGDPPSGLMDHHNKGHLVLVGDEPHVLDGGLRVRCRQPGGGLVSKHDLGSRSKTTGKRQASALPSRDASDTCIPDVRVLHTEEAQIFEAPFRPESRHAQGELRGALVLQQQVEQHLLLHGEVRRHDVILGHVGAHARPHPVSWTAVQMHRAAVGCRLLSRQDI